MQASFVIVDSIEINGNDRTLDAIVLRELNISPGDSILLEKLPEVMKQNSFLLLNTGLFTKAEINIKKWQTNNSLALKIDLEEAWYIYPLPILELADRNFNVWWSEHNRNLRRLNYGVRFDHTNFSGRRDHLRLIAQFGYTRKYEFKYGLPYVNRAKTWGADLVVNLKQQRQVQLNTVNNRQQFFPENINEAVGGEFMFQSFETRLEFSHRPKIQWNHYLTTLFRQNSVADIIVEKNPNFFETGKKQQRFFSLSYRMIFDSRDIKPYPTKGKKAELVISKAGLGIFNELNTFNITASYSQYFPLGKRWISGHNLRNRSALIRKEQPFSNTRALGFGTSFVRGYEFYVVDGIDFFLSRNTVSFEAFNVDLSWGKYMPIEAFRRIPIKLYLTAFGDTGYANNPSFRASNPFSNRALFGYGVGVNLVLYYDKVFIAEYSFNGEGESGLFVRTQMSF